MKLNFCYLILLISSAVFAQKDCGFVPDTTKILNDKNVDLFLQRLRTDTFEICTTKNQIPKQITKTLECLNHGEFSISELHEEYQNSDIIEDENIPYRGLIFLAKNENTLVVYYGITNGPGISSKIVLIDYSEKGIKDMWVGTNPGTRKIETIEDAAGFVSTVIEHDKVLRPNSLHF